MNADLAYCLEQFIVDQIQLIDDDLETVKTNEKIEYRQLEQGKRSYETQLKSKPHQGSHDEDEAIIQRFIQRLLDLAEDTSTADQLENYREMFRTEFHEKLTDCSTYVTRLCSLARPILGSEEFVAKCKEAIDDLNHKQKTGESYRELSQVMERSSSTSVAQDIQHWWEKKYGLAIREITQLNKRFNPGVGNSNFSLIPDRGGMVGYAKRILALLNDEPLIDSQKYDLVCKFVHQMRSLDDENRRETNEDDLIIQLNNSDVDVAIDYAVRWLDKRDTNRSRKDEEPNPYKTRWQEVKTQFDCQRVAQEAKKSALASLLRRLAIGSNFTEQFDRTLKKTLDEQKQGVGLPVMIGDVKEPNVDRLAMSIRLEGADLDQWLRNSNHIHEGFTSSLCRAFHIPERSICITEVKYGSVIIVGFVAPPFGKNVLDILHGVAPDSPARIKAVRECCSAVKGKIECTTLGDCGLSIDQKLMDPLWNRIYTWSYNRDGEGHHWDQPLDRGGKPYFCPSGWQRFGVKVAENDRAFDARWGSWYLGYHGTKGNYATDILTSGLHVSTRGCYYDKGIPRIYLSPSIEYCAHSRYANPWKKIDSNGKTRWFQLVFQCRVNPKVVEKIRAETLLNHKHKSDVKIDPHFENSELERVIPGKEGCQTMDQDIICYGLMMRVSDVDPKELPSSIWWKYC